MISDRRIDRDRDEAGGNRLQAYRRLQARDQAERERAVRARNYLK